MKEAILVLGIMIVVYLWIAIISIQTKNEIENKRIDIENKRVNIETHRMIDEICDGRSGSYNGKNLICK